MQVHACPNPGACSMKNRTQLLMDYQSRISAGNSTFNQTAYWSMQCAQGYTGKFNLHRHAICCTMVVLPPVNQPAAPPPHVNSTMQQMQ